MVTRDAQHSLPQDRLRVAVLGAGLAGACVARALAKDGHAVVVFDQASSAAQGASGNPIGILHPLVSKDRNLATRWVELGMATTLRWLEILSASSSEPIGRICGVLEMSEDCTELVDWSPGGAWIRPERFVNACLLDAQQSGASIYFNHRVGAIAPDGKVSLTEKETGGTKVYEFDHIVVCLADAMEGLLSPYSLMLNSIRGTVSSYAVDVADSLPCVICADGYATPVVDGAMVVGASYERLVESPPLGETSGLVESPIRDEIPDPRTVLSNLDRLRNISPRLAEHCQGQRPVDRTSVRSATLDRMPHVGRVLDLSRPLTPQMSQIRHLPRCDRLWVLGGLGSRGLSSAPLGAEIISAQLKGVPAPVPERLLAAVDPVRFALRRHQRRK